MNLVTPTPISSSSRPRLREPGLPLFRPGVERHLVRGAGAVILHLFRGDRVSVTDREGRQPCEIAAFAPEVALVCVGGADSLIFPAWTVQRLIDKYAPKEWQGVEGMMPLARYSRDRWPRLAETPPWRISEASRFGGSRPGSSG